MSINVVPNLTQIQTTIQNDWGLYKFGLGVRALTYLEKQKQYLLLL